MPTPQDRFKKLVFDAHGEAVKAYEDYAISIGRITVEDVAENKKPPEKRSYKPIDLTPEKFLKYEAEARDLVYGTPEKPGFDQRLMLAKDVPEVAAIMKEASKGFREAGLYTAWEFARVYVTTFHKEMRKHNTEYRELMKDEHTLGHTLPRPPKSHAHDANAR